MLFHSSRLDISQQRVAARAACRRQVHTDPYGAAITHHTSPRQPITSAASPGVGFNVCLLSCRVCRCPGSVQVGHGNIETSAGLAVYEPSTHILPYIVQLYNTFQKRLRCPVYLRRPPCLDRADLTDNDAQRCHASAKISHSCQNTTNTRKRLPICCRFIQRVRAVV